MIQKNTALNRFILISLATFIFTPCFANNTNNNNAIYLSIGSAFSSLSTHKNFDANDTSQTYFYTNHTQQIDPDFEIAFAHTFPNLFHHPIALSLGMGVNSIDFSDVNGHVYTYDSGGALLSHLGYSYQVSDIALLFEQRLAFTRYRWQPYLITGVGESWNRMDRYRQNQVEQAGFVGITPDDRAFDPHSNTAFAYEAGLGVQHPLSKHIAVTADYRYMDLGNGRLGELIQHPETADRVKVNALTANVIMISLKLLF